MLRLNHRPLTLKGLIQEPLYKTMRIFYITCIKYIFHNCNMQLYDQLLFSIYLSSFFIFLRVCLQWYYRYCLKAVDWLENKLPLCPEGKGLCYPRRGYVTAAVFHKIKYCQIWNKYHGNKIMPFIVGTLTCCDVVYLPHSMNSHLESHFAQGCA